MSFNRPVLSGLAGASAVYRQDAIKSAPYVASGSDDLILSSANVTLNANPEPGDIVTVGADGAAISVAGNGFLINGLASIALAAGDVLQLAFDGVKWTGGLASAAPARTVVGTPGGQAQTEQSFLVLGTTANAATLTVNTGYAPPAGHAAKLDGGISLTDRTAHTASSKNLNAALTNYGGLAISGTPTVSGTTGDGALSTATITFSVVAGTLGITFTPPAAYAGGIDWEVSFTSTEN